MMQIHFRTIPYHPPRSWVRLCNAFHKCMKRQRMSHLRGRHWCRKPSKSWWSNRASPGVSFDACVCPPTMESRCLRELENVFQTKSKILIRTRSYMVVISHRFLRRKEKYSITSRRIQMHTTKGSTDKPHVHWLALSSRTRPRGSSFLKKLWMARSRQYRGRRVQVTTPIAECFKLYTSCTLVTAVPFHNPAVVQPPLNFCGANCYAGRFLHLFLRRICGLESCFAGVISSFSSFLGSSARVFQAFFHLDSNFCTALTPTFCKFRQIYK